VTAYQRGNRDGLRSLASRLYAEADALDALADGFRARAAAARLSRTRTAADRLAVQNGLRAAGLRDAAAAALLAAEALPEDPEGD
jgi:hypothetical protein